jgi:pimeloyl-ACP methyl ester carboxylesterase
MDGTGRLFARFQKAMPRDFDLEVVSYPAEAALGYDALALRVPLPTAPFAILAESFSGPIGIRLAARGSPHLRALVLVASFARCPIRAPRWLGALARPPLVRIGNSPNILRTSLLDHDAPDDLVEEVRATLRTVRPDVLAYRMRTILEDDVAAAFASIQVPVMYLRARRDRLVPARVVEELSRVRPDLVRVEIDAPHMVLQSQPQQAATAIVDFLRRIG